MHPYPSDLVTDDDSRTYPTGPCTRPDDVPHDCAVSCCYLWTDFGWVPKVRAQGPDTLQDWKWHAAMVAADAAGWNLVVAERRMHGITT